MIDDDTTTLALFEDATLARYRVLDPAAGRWAQQDSLGGFVDGANLYEAVISNPLVRRDFSGQSVTNNTARDIWVFDSDYVVGGNAATGWYELESGGTGLAVRLEFRFRARVFF